MRAMVFKRLIAVGALGASCLLPSACLINDDNPPLEPIADPEPAAPPPAIRTVPDAGPGTRSDSDGGTEGDPGSGAGNGTLLDLPRCMDDRTTHCCSYKGRNPGFPECTWILLKPGESEPITRALAEPYRTGKAIIPIDVPPGVTIADLRPDALYSDAECRTAAAGFRLAGAGLAGASSFSALWAIHKDGTWIGLAAGTAQVLSWDTPLHPNLAPEPFPIGFDKACDYAKVHPETKYIAEVVYEINFFVDDKAYYAAASLPAPGERDAMGYMYMVEKKY